MNPNRFLLCFVLMGSVAVFGCWGPPRPAGLPRLYRTTLKITQENIPLADASIYLFPVESKTANWTVAGKTSADGTAIIYTHGKFPGAPLGKYKVCVEKTFVGSADPRANDPEPEDKQSAEYFRYIERKSMGSDARPLYEMVESQYKTPEETPLEIDILKGKNTAQFDVGKSVQINIEAHGVINKNKKK